MAPDERMYEVWLLSGAGPGSLVARFRKFEHAEEYARDHSADGRLDIKMPNGRWYGRRKTMPMEDIERFLAEQGKGAPS